MDPEKGEEIKEENNVYQTHEQSQRRSHTLTELCNNKEKCVAIHGKMIIHIVQIKIEEYYDFTTEDNHNI